MTFRIDGSSVFGATGTFRGLLKISSSSSTSTTGTDAATQATARDDIKAAARELVDALGQLTYSTAKPAPPTYVLGALPSTLVGKLAHLGVLGGTQSVLQATHRVNTTVSTARSSTLPVGLDLSPAAVSKLRSTILGLDVTSPTAPSHLASAGNLGLDVTSPAEASLLASSQALGLDLTSPNAPSVLASAHALGLDLTSPETASRLYSAALGLDLTSPNAPSTLASALALGIDITSPETTSVLRSSATLGLDVTTPAAASHLTSSTSLGLDVTTPASATSLRSSAPIGLDLTSPDAPSTLASSATLGVDVTSPETSSVLTSSTTLGLNITDASSTIQSMAEMNTSVTTSYSPSDLGFATLTGTFAGVNTAASATSLTVTVLNNANLNVILPSALQFEVRDQDGALLFSFNGNARSSQSISLGSDIGLSVSFDAGSHSSGQSAATAITRTPVTVDTAALFNAAPASRPKFDGGATVHAGSFSINGTSITVNANDSIGSVLSRINLSAAGVTASASSDKVTLTSNSASEDAITISGDTSGFVAATKLSGASTVTGNLRDDTQALEDTPQFASVASGSFTVNGASISVDTSADSVTSIVGRINASAAGVTASYDSVNDKLVLTSNANSEDQIAVADDTTGFLSAAHLAAGNTVLGNIHDDQQTLAKTLQFASVTDGSFTINGVSIAAAQDSDTLASIVSRINGAGAGVTATYDSGADKLRLTGTTNSEDLIAVGNDTSGFLDAAKLDTSNTARGHLSEDGVALNDITAFGGVTNGSFVLDGHSISVSTSDSLNDIVDRINNSGARVVASYDGDNDRLQLDATYDSEDELPIGSDTSGFLAAVHLDPANSALGNIADDTQVLAKTSQFASVTDGSFSINGVAIAVGRNADSLSTIAARITASTAGVTASFDSGSSIITLTGNGPSEDDIVVDGDTSGFLDAAHLASGNTVRGNLADDVQVLAKTSQFGSVTSGSFDINGTSIAVDAANDSLEGVVARINTSGAGVTAAYDAGADRITLTSNANSEDDVVVGNDSTGFLAAAHLATSNTEQGNIHDDSQVLAKTSQFGAVTSGSFTINGVSISVDRDTDTLSMVIDRINNASAGVTAAYDSLADTVVLTGAEDSEDLIDVGDAATGFLAAAHLDTANTARGHLPEDGVVLGDLPGFAGIVAGSFVVDGHQIDVDPTVDTVETIVDKINQSGARVVAAYDTNSDAISLLATYNSEDQVPIGSDTSGFLAAAGIDVGNTLAGNLRDDQQVLAKTTQFGAVADGSFTVNGVAIAVNANNDTLTDVIDRIDGAGAGVTAAYDGDTDSIVLTANADGEGLIDVGDDTTGFLAAASLNSVNTARGHLPEDGVPLDDIAAFAGVTAGSSTIDGATISVDPAIDTIQTLVDRINNSGARVTASYDSNVDKLVLSAGYDSEDDVPLGNDSSGFLAAAHLDSANTVTGNLADDVQTLSKTTQFGGVTTGSFDVNGVSISVDTATDSLTDVLDRITSSAAGVTAVFDTGANGIVLTGKADSEDAIVVNNDTTGFLVAAQLDGANTVRGNLRDDEQVLAKTAQFAGVADGSFTLNGVSIDVDVANDTLSGLVARINGAHAGATATYDAQADRLVLTNDAASEELVDVGGDTSGFLAAAGIDTNNTERGNIPDDQQVLSKTTQFAAVDSGSFVVNGATIPVDANTDSLASVIARVNASAANVTASYDSLSDAVTLTPNNPGAALFVGDDDTGLLSALHVTSGSAALTLDPDAEFDATQLAAPMFDLGTSVHAGSFTVNGAQIDVGSGDSINSVIARINASAAGVTAAYDTGAGTISLTANERSSQAIALGADSSGFLAAVKLDGTASNVAGVDPSPAAAVPLSEMDEYGRVTEGTLVVNGTRITVDPNTTTIRDLISHLNSVNGITASVDDTTGRVAINATGDGYPLRISDPSNVLSVLGIATIGPLREVPAKAQAASGITNASDVAAMVAKAAKDLDAALAYYSVTGAAVQKSLKAVMALLASAGAKGVNIQLPKPGNKSTNPGAQGPTVVVDQSVLAASLTAGGRVVADNFLENGGFATAANSLFDRFAENAVKVATKPSDDLASKVKATFDANNQ